MADARWRFREMARAEMNQDPMEREFFADEPVNARLVREAIQNSLDAAPAGAVGSEPVRVRFSLRGVREPVDVARTAPYLTGLTEHLQAGLEWDDIPLSLERPVNYLVIEDAGTVGLEGNWQQYDDSEAQPAEGNHFYWFFRNVGRSGKRENEAGSWGLGKWVFPDASRASAYIAVTRRRSDDEVLLMGQAVLKKHTLRGMRFAPYGYFGVIEGQGTEALDVPLRGSDPGHTSLIGQCIADFGLQYRDEPGLSVIIPFPRIEEDSTVTGRALLAETIRNYFYPVIAGRLEVEIDEGDGSTPLHITQDTIDDLLSRLDLAETGEQSIEGYGRLFEMCREKLTRPDNEYIFLSSPPRSGGEYQQRAKIEELRDQYHSGERLGFRIETTVRRKNGTDEQAQFYVCVQRDEALRVGQDFYVRDPLSISNIDKIERHPTCALLVVDNDEPLAAMLRDSEPPAHTTWRPQHQNVTSRWVSAKARIDEVQNTPRELLAILEGVPVALDRDALADIFPSNSGNRRRPDKKKGDGPEPPPPPLPPRQEDFIVSRSVDGFQVKLAPELQEPLHGVRIQAAYDAPRGNPLKAYHPHDFRLHGLGALSVQATGCQVRSGARENELLLEVKDSSQFSLAVRGFDQHRDVYVSVERMKPAAESETVQ